MYPTSVGVWAMPIPPPVRVRGDTPQIYSPSCRGAGAGGTYKCRRTETQASKRKTVFSQMGKHGDFFL